MQVLTSRFPAKETWTSVIFCPQIMADNTAIIAEIINLQFYNQFERASFVALLIVDYKKNCSRFSLA